MIRCAVPGLSVSGSVRPAGMSSATGSSTGCSAVAPATSSATTAYPSIAELSKPGSDSGATTSSASTSPSASAMATVTGGLRTIRSATTRRCSSTDRIRRGRSRWSISRTLPKVGVGVPHRTTVCWTQRVSGGHAAARRRRDRSIRRCARRDRWPRAAWGAHPSRHFAPSIPTRIPLAARIHAG